MRRNAALIIAGLVVVLAAGAWPPESRAAGGSNFSITVDRLTWEKWGFEYPVTYVFRLPAGTRDVEVRRRDTASSPWTALARKTAEEFFNGIECVRIDRDAGRAYVSIGFKAAPAIELQFSVPGVAFDSIARFYDGRRAAFTLSLDNWGCNPWAHPGAPWKGPTCDESDNYQAALHVCRGFRLPVTMAINSRMAGGEAMWRTMQEELDRGDRSWEPAVHGRSHPRDRAAYLVQGYQAEILGCRADILAHLRNIPYGQRVYEHILTFGHQDDMIEATDAGEFLFLRGFNWLDNPTSTDYAPWNAARRFYGIGGLNTKGYDRILETREPKGRFYARDVAELNDAFDRLLRSGGIFYALWHPDRFRNSVVYDPNPGEDGVRGSTLVQHLTHVAGRKDVWYVANGWLYTYRYAAEHARVTPTMR